LKRRVGAAKDKRSEEKTTLWEWTEHSIKENIRDSNANAPRCVDIFSGGGGLTLGFHGVGWDTVFGLARDRMSFATYSTNFLTEGTPHGLIENWPNWLPKRNHDIPSLLMNTEMTERLSSLRNVDAVIGGPPCQGFSVAGKRLADDPRNTLALAFCKFVKVVKPKLFLMENVEGITHRLKDSNGEKERTSTADAIVNEMRTDGYIADYHVLNAEDFGVPQLRRRTVIVGIAKSESLDLSTFWDSLPRSAREVRAKYRLGNGPITVEDAISDLDSPNRLACPDSPNFETSPYEEPQSEYQRQLRHGSPASSIPDSHRYARHGEIVKRRFEMIQSKSRYGRQPNRFLRSIGIYSTNKNKIHWLDPAQPATTISSQPGDFLHPFEPRELTVREMARIQSFPDNFLIRGRYTINGPRRPFDTARCSQVGNAVPPLMAEGLGLSLARLLR